jgi:glycine/D-amino acid oxidase-like deaminating enzyme
MIGVTPDVLPVLDQVAPLPGLYLATGFSGHGFGVGPATGHVMADLVTGETPAVDLEPFRFSRFSDGTPMEAQQHL